MKLKMLTCIINSQPNFARIMSGLTGGGKTENEHSSANEEFAFDQYERHRLLCQYIREKEWETVAAFFEKKVSDLPVKFPILRFFMFLTISVNRIYFRSHHSKKIQNN